jgi:hypothetical protein
VGLLFAVLLTANAQATCPAGADGPGDHARAALAAYEQLEVERFRALVQRAHDAVPCLEAPIDPDDAAQLHLAMALEAWTERDEERVVEALRGLLSLEPSYQPSVVIAPEGGGLATAFEAARAAGPGSTDPMIGLELWVDGRSAPTLPRERAALVQWTATDRLESRYTWPEDPSAELRRASRQVGAPLPSGSHRSRGLAIAAGATGLVALLAAGQANDAWDAFHATDSWDEAQRHYTRNRVFAVGSGITGVGALGLAAGAVVVWEW